MFLEQILPLTSTGAKVIGLRRLTNQDNADARRLSLRCAVTCSDPFRIDRNPDFFRWPRAVFDDFEYVGAFDDGKLVASVCFGFTRGSIAGRTQRVAWVVDARDDRDYRGQRLLARAI